jgi:hypothetical protein
VFAPSSNILLDNKLNDELDIKYKGRMLYGRSNMLICKLYFCSAFVKHKLFSAYCTNIYVCTLWAQYKEAASRSITVAYNNALELYWVYNMQLIRCSASGVFAVNQLMVLKILVLCV